MEGLPKTMEEKKYNGWTNYETWDVKLWIDNEESSYRYWREQTRECWEESEHDKDECARKLSDRLKSEHEDQTPVTTGVYADLLNAALSEVNWYEIAEAMITDEEFEEDEEEEEEGEDEEEGESESE